MIFLTRISCAPREQTCPETKGVDCERGVKVCTVKATPNGEYTQVVFVIIYKLMRELVVMTRAVRPQTGARSIVASPPPVLFKTHRAGIGNITLAEWTRPLQPEPLIHTLLVEVMVTRESPKILLVLVVAQTD
jgi:hypothetical protein